MLGWMSIFIWRMELEIQLNMLEPLSGARTLKNFPLRLVHLYQVALLKFWHMRLGQLNLMTLFDDVVVLYDLCCELKPDKFKLCHWPLALLIVAMGLNRVHRSDRKSVV